MSEPETLPAPTIDWSNSRSRSRLDWQREYHAFLRLLPELLKTHRDQWVAVHNGQVVDGDADDVALVQRVIAKIGYVPMHLGFVTDEPALSVRMPRFRVRTEPPA